MITFWVNESRQTFDGDEGTPLLWVLREHLDLKGTKFGCGIASCGSCTVLMDGRATRSCVTPAGTLEGKRITTIEGLAAGAALHPVQRAWIEEDVAQCGYCQTGQIMAVTDFLARYPDPTDRDIDENLTNLCRCGTYNRIRRAIHRAAGLMRQYAAG